jgi:hypothetical protein
VVILVLFRSKTFFLGMLIFLDFYNTLDSPIVVHFPLVTCIMEEIFVLGSLDLVEPEFSFVHFNARSC